MLCQYLHVRYRVVVRNVLKILLSKMHTHWNIGSAHLCPPLFPPAVSQLKEADSCRYSCVQCSETTLVCSSCLKAYMYGFILRLFVMTAVHSVVCNSYHTVSFHGQSLEDPGKWVSLNRQLSFGRVWIACFNSHTPLRTQVLIELLFVLPSD